MYDEILGGGLEQGRITESYRWELDTWEHLENLRLKLVGKAIDPQGRIIDTKRKIMNEDGANAVIAHVSAFVPHHIILGNLEKKEVKQMAMTCGENVADLLIDHYKDFNMDLANIQPVVKLVYYTVYGILSRAINGREGEMRAPNKRIIEQKLISSDKDKEAFINTGWI